MHKPKTLSPSAELFKFCRALAESRTGSHRMSDGEIGRIVGFENARTSRWKHGTIHVDDAGRLLKLSEELDVDLSLLVRVASGLVTAEEALEVSSHPGPYLAFLSEAIRLPCDGMGLDLIASPGGHARLKKQGHRHYQRHASPEQPDRRPVGSPRATALLVDDDEATIKVFRTLAAERPGIRVAAAGSGAEGLIEAGRLHPDLIVFDVFLPGVDGFAAIRAFRRVPSTKPAYLVVTASSPGTELVSRILGAGADEALGKPLSQRQIGRLLARIV